MFPRPELSLFESLRRRDACIGPAIRLRYLPFGFRIVHNDFSGAISSTTILAARWPMQYLMAAMRDQNPPDYSLLSRRNIKENKQFAAEGMLTQR
jgi:hypothetical protein